MLHYINFPLFDVEFIDDTPLIVALFNVSLSDLELLNVELFTVALFKAESF